ncbi:sulfur carrier protein ThiS [Nocardioides jensenii]|uniref:sulfur carrier protein ThiS n=1 Tax=Nocardioides jensenii TaxID=1843 RepID=UPI00082E2EE8|nr:sulfur carrier protein ThiS [Nocardioides jensenii]
MQITINGSAAEVDESITVAALVRDRIEGDRRIAVAVNSGVVPRSQWETTQLGPGDSIELLAAAAGG